MNSNNKSRWLPLCASGGGIFLFFGVMFFLHRQSQYLPFLLGSVFFLLFGSVNLILVLFRKDIPLRPREASKEPAGAVEDAKAPEGKPNPNAILSQTLRVVGKLLCKIPYVLATLYNRIRRTVTYLLLFAALVGFGIYFGLKAFAPPAEIQPILQYWHLVVLVALFLTAIVFDKICKHWETDDEFLSSVLKNARVFSNFAKLVVLAQTVAVAMVMLKLYDIRMYLVYGLAVVYYYASAMLLLSLAVRVIRRELSTRPTIVILLPFVASDSEELSVLSFLEENTGITLRSLWSIKYVKKILPMMVFGMVLLLWVSTGLVYVQSHQEAVVYRFGVMQEETLEPGLHLTLPFPVDKSVIYDTETVNKVTIGYRASENVDNVWTAGHGENEYKLLLGSGDEVVSLNLRVEYKIDDLKEYLRSATTPDRILEAKAYELTLTRTINTDLSTLLATDREAFANSFCEELAHEVEAAKTGIKVVSVIMESIHPPVEVAEVYQDFIAVGIDAERIIIEAEASAIKLIYSAEANSIKILNQANARYYDKVAAARYEVAEFMAAVAAYEENPEAYAYYKALEAIKSAYPNAKLIILGEDIEGSRLVFWGGYGITE